MYNRKATEKRAGKSHVQAASDEDDHAELAEIPLDVAVNEPLTWKKLKEILSLPATWLPTLTYMTTFVRTFFLSALSRSR